MSQTRKDFFKKGYRKDLIQLIANNINNDESFTLLGMPGIGISSLLTYIEDDDFITRFKIKKSSLIVYIDLNNLLETNLISLYRLIFKRLIECIKKSECIPNDVKAEIAENYKQIAPVTDTFILFEETKDTLKLLTEKGVKVVFILDEFIKLKDIGKVAFSNLKAIRDIDKDFISFIFIGNQNLPDLIGHDLLEGLYTIFRFKFVYVKPPTRAESDFVFKEHEDKFEIKINKEMRDKIYELSGGNLWFMKKINGIYSEEPTLLEKGNGDLIEKLLKKYDVEITLDYFWDKLSKRDQDDIVNIVKNKETYTKNSYLVESGIIIEKDPGFEFFSPILPSYIKEFMILDDEVENVKIEDCNHIYKVNKEDRIILKEGKVIGADLTKTEFDVVAYLIENEGKAVTRDELGVVMWGEERFEKYSDYAIDRLISRIRSKIGENASAPKYLKTVKGIGFRFNNE